MLSPCDCGGKKVVSQWCKTIYPGIHGWRCDACGAKGQCYCAGPVHCDEMMFDTMPEALAADQKRYTEQ